MDMKDFFKAVKVVMERKPEIIEAAKQVEDIGTVVYNLIVSAMSAYESAKFGTYSRSVMNEDAMAIIEEMGKE